MCRLSPRLSLSRRAVLVSAAAGAAVALAPDSGAAQFFQVMCSWSGAGYVGVGLAPAAPKAMEDVRAIMQAIGFFAPMQVYQGGVRNAAATVIGFGPAIVYNAGFLNALESCSSVAPVTVLAHEVGHHANRDTTWAGQFRHPWSRELGADWVSGLAMRRLGVGLDLARSGIACSFGVFSPGSMTHPDSQNRLRAVTEGWYAG